MPDRYNLAVPDLLPPWPLLAAFLAASFVLAVTPGPGVVYIVTRSLAEGRRAGLASVGGVALGNLGNAIGASLGLAALLAASATAFLAVKYAGAAYLVWLGVKALRGGRERVHGATVPKEAAEGAGSSRLTAMARPPRSRPIFRDGFVVALLNPKTAVFFAAFLPQFMSPQASHGLQSVVLGIIFVAIAAVTDTAYALAAGSLGPAIARAARVRAAGRYASGGAFIGLGLYTALSGARAAR
jgi:threonine/homoserine/homoserine lactone efflux protein